MGLLLHHMLQNSALRHADHEALVDGDQRLDYATMAGHVSALASGLTALGVDRGDRVAIYLRPSAALPLAMLAVSQADAVFVPVHHGMFPAQVAHILRDSGAKAVLSDRRRWQTLGGILAQTPELEFAVLVEGDETAASNPRQPATVPAEGHRSRPTHDFQALCRETAPHAVGAQCVEEDLAAILYTSGSVGQPKGVMLSHANVVAGAAIVSEYLEITSRDRVLAALPLSFDAGLNQLTTAILNGGTTVMIRFRFGRDIVHTLVDERITGLAGVPSLWSLLAQPSSGLGRQPLPSLRYITSTGGAMPSNVLAQLRAKLPKTKVFLMCGLTEAFRSTYLPPEELDRRPGSMGKAIPRTEILVLNDAGNICGPGEVGELVHHGPTVSLGYWGHPQLTDRVFRRHPKPASRRERRQRVCYSGDLVRLDDEGFLYFVGRRDDQIKSAGFRISPTEVEEVIWALLTSKWVEVQVGATRSYAIWAVTA